MNWKTKTIMAIKSFSIIAVLLAFGFYFVSSGMLYYQIKVNRFNEINKIVQAKDLKIKECVKVADKNFRINKQLLLELEDLSMRNSEVRKITKKYK